MFSESSAHDSAGQGSLPEVPKAGIACTFCAGEIVGIEEGLPHRCPHCHKELRPASDSWLSYLWFAMRRMFSCCGRATRKEFWILTILLSIFASAALIAICVDTACWLDSDDCDMVYLYAGAGLVLILLLLALGQCCLTVRRLHDIGFSGYLVLLACMLSVASFISYIVPFVSIIRDFYDAYVNYIVMLSQLSFVENEIASAEELAVLCGLAEPDLEHQMNYLIYTWYSYSVRVLLNILYTADIIISGFLFVSCFIDSQCGTNKYGLSRKYPFA